MFSIARTDLTLSLPTASFQGMGLRSRMSRVCMIADTLSWAVRHNIPLQQALPSLPFCRRLDVPLFGALVVLGWMFGPFLLMLPFPWLMDLSWSSRIGRLIKDIDKGEKLSVSLRKNFRRKFPKFYLLGVEKAESENRLDTALPILAHQLNYPCSVARERKIELFFVLKKFFVTVLMITFITTNVAPKFHEIFQELCGTVPPAGFMPLAAIMGALARIAIWAVVLILVLPRLGSLGEVVLLRLPVFGSDLKRFILGDLARSMAAFVRQGDDVVSAAEWSLKATRSHWMKKRLGKFISSVRDGARWEKAWLDMKVGRSLDQWVIANAALREDPASGFELLAAWLHQETELSTKRLERWVDPISTLAIALLVGTLCYYVFSALIAVIHGLL